MSDHEDIAEHLLRLGAATLGESGGRPMRNRIRPAWSGASLAAPAFTVRCSPGDNLPVHVGVARSPTAHALVVSVGDERELGYWGEVLTTAAEARGLIGLVIDGCVRDAAALEAHRFPVFSTGLALPGATKEHAGEVGAGVMVGDVEVHTGDWVVADVDGVTVVPRASLDAVLAAGQARADKEDGMFAALRAGATTIDVLGLDAALVAAPVVVEGPDTTE
jgi:4-hydroxy-4-methyl-2-oxoglutarate aldolase